ncbi:DUF6213 family protein [Streptomyces tateyamensis]|uniref:DUF6213 family protein n=1 Tax=Streptomyces tateyamensis TaxID=565073 RepID=UPI0011B615BF|nr:DUF6213 family protein [Streptomyces tateyamensis]
MSVTVVATPEDGLLVPAGQLTALLRGLGAEWLRWGTDPQLGLDQATLQALARILTDLADQVDAECIGLASRTD